MDEAAFLGAIARVENPSTSEALGTAFLVTSGGCLITCRHILENAGDAVVVRFGGTGAPIPARVELLGSKSHDLARLHIEAHGLLPSPLPLAARAQTGSRFRSFGFRLAKYFNGLPAEGEIRQATSRVGPDGLRVPVLPLHTNEVSEGMSGAPVLDVAQEAVVGVISLWWETTRAADAFTAFAIPVDTLLALWPELLDDNPNLARRRRGLWGEHQRQHLERLSEKFVGRHEALTTVEAFVADKQPRSLWISAPAGFGKSSLFAKLIRSRPGCVYHFVLPDEGWMDLLNSLCAQLAELTGEPLPKTDDREERQNLFTRLLDAAASGRPIGEPLPVFIDGLDEGVDTGGDRVVQPLLFAEPPDGARLILGFRSGLESVLPQVGAAQVMLPEFQTADVQELFAAFDRPDLAADADLAKEIVARTAGEPFYARWLGEELSRQTGPVRVPNTLPPKVEEFLHAEIRRLIASEAPNGAGLVLAVLTRSRGWMRQQSLSRILFDRLGADVVRRTIETFRPRYLVTQPAPNPLAIGEMRVRLWPLRLKAAVETMLDGVELEEAERLIVKFCRNWAAHGDAYAVEHGMEHVLAVGDLSAALPLLRRDYLLAHAEIAGGLHAPRRDAEQILRVAIEHRDSAAVVLAAGVHAWLNAVIRTRASLGSVAVDAKAGRIDLALATAKSLREGKRRGQQLLIVAIALLDRGDTGASVVLEEAMRDAPLLTWQDKDVLLELSKDAIVKLDRVDLARELWRRLPDANIGDFETVLAAAAAALIEREPDRALSLVDTFSEIGARIDLLEELRDQSVGTARLAIEKAIEALRRQPPPNARVFDSREAAVRWLREVVATAARELAVGRNADAYDKFNAALIDLVGFDLPAAVDVARKHARLARRYVLSAIGDALAESGGPVETIHELLAIWRVDADWVAVDSLLAALARTSTDPEEAIGALEGMSDRSEAAHLALKRWPDAGQNASRLAAIIGRPDTLTTPMAAALQALDDDDAERLLHNLAPGVIRWQTSLVRRSSNPGAMAELLTEVETLPRSDRLEALIDLSRRFDTVEPLERAAAILTADDMNDEWREAQAVRLLDALARTGLRADRALLTKLLAMVHRPFTRGLVVLRVHGMEDAVENAADIVKSRKVSVAYELSQKAVRLGDGSLLKALEDLFDEPVMKFRLRVARAEASPPQSHDRSERLDESVLMLETVVDPPPLPVRTLGQLLAAERPELVARAAVAIDDWRRVLLYSAAAATVAGPPNGFHPTSFFSKRRRQALAWLRDAERAAEGIGVNPAQPLTEPVKGSPAPWEAQEELRARAINRARALTNILIEAGDPFPAHRRRWLRIAFTALESCNDPQHCVPEAFKLALRFHPKERSTCERFASRAIRTLEQLHGWTTPLISELREALERPPYNETAALKQRAWRTVLAAETRDRRGAPVRMEASLQDRGRAVYWVKRLGGSVDPVTLARIRAECEALGDRIEAMETRVLLTCADALADPASAAARFHEPIVHDRLLTTVIAYFPDVTEWRDLWLRLLEQVRSAEALQAAVARALGTPALADVLPRFSNVPSSRARMEAFGSATDSMEPDSMEMAKHLSMLFDAALDDPEDTTIYAAAWVRTIGRDLRGILNALVEVDRLSSEPIGSPRRERPA